MNYIKMIIYNIFLDFKYIFIPDKIAICLQYKKNKHKRLNFENPQTFSEKLCYLKLYERNPLFTLCSDKYRINDYLNLLNLNNIQIPIIKVYKNPRQINFSELPEEFVIKMNHQSGYNFLINKNNCTKEQERKVKITFQILKHRNFYKVAREWSYKYIDPVVIVQKALKTSDGKPLVDYKFYCFNGYVKYFMVSIGELIHETRNHKYDRNLVSIDKYFKKHENLSESEITLPENINEMIEIADKLSKPFKHVRVDLYNVEGKIYFGEMTFYTNAGYPTIWNSEFDKEIGSWIDIS